MVITVLLSWQGSVIVLGRVDWQIFFEGQVAKTFGGGGGVAKFFLVGGKNILESMVVKNNLGSGGKIFFGVGLHKVFGDGW